MAVKESEVMPGPSEKSLELEKELIIGGPV